MIFLDIGAGDPLGLHSPFHQKANFPPLYILFVVYFSKFHVTVSDCVFKSVCAARRVIKGPSLTLQLKLEEQIWKGYH